MMIMRLVLLAFLVAAPSAVHAQAKQHSHAAEHGGQIQFIGKVEAELVVKGAEVTLYLNDEDDRKLDAAKFTATVVVLAKGNEQKTLALAAAGDNKLVGKTDFAVDGKFRATVTLKSGSAEVGKARYNLDPAR